MPIQFSFFPISCKRVRLSSCRTIDMQLMEKLLTRLQLLGGDQSLPVYVTCTISPLWNKHERQSIFFKVLFMDIASTTLSVSLPLDLQHWLSVSLSYLVKLYKELDKIVNTNNQTHDFLFTMLSPVCTCTTKYDSREGKNVKFEHKVHCTMYTQCTCYKYLANGSLFCTVLTPFFIYNSTCTSIHTFIDLQMYNHPSPLTDTLVFILVLSLSSYKMYNAPDH